MTTRLPDRGDTFHRRGQKYRFDGWTDHYTQDGRWTDIAEVTSWCADCGGVFHFRTRKSGILRGPLNRRCERHHKPGIRVRPKRGHALTRPKSRSLIRAEQRRDKQRARIDDANRATEAYRRLAFEAEKAAERERRRAEDAKARARKAEAAADAAVAEAEAATRQAQVQIDVARQRMHAQQRAAAEWHKRQRLHTLTAAQAIRTERRKASKRRAAEQRRRAAGSPWLG